jgi:hypothetical protein
MNFKTVEGVETAYSWTDEETAYDLGLGKFGIGVEDLQHPLPPVQVFHG